MNKRDQRKWFKSLAGKIIKNEWKLKKFLGHGKIGYVYLAENINLKALQRAIKIMPDAKDGWKNEINKVCMLSDIPNVVQFLHIDTEQLISNNRTEIFQYSCWQYIPPGRNLRKYLKEKTSCSVSFFLTVIKTILTVLHACQIRGVPRHGDLHSGNILIGEPSEEFINPDTLEKQLPIYVADFGYGATGEIKAPKDDLKGLQSIINDMLKRIDRNTANSNDRKILQELTRYFRKVLDKQTLDQIQAPLKILEGMKSIKQSVCVSQETNAIFKHSASISNTDSSLDESLMDRSMQVGQFQVSEMLGEDWDKWRKLFVSSVPAKIKILEPDISTVLTGPRGCGKTMLFKRLSERLMVECGPIEKGKDVNPFVAFYINANDFSDAFPNFPESPAKRDQTNLICYANLCILSDVLSVQSAYCVKNSSVINSVVIDFLNSLLSMNNKSPIAVGENEVEHYSSQLEIIKAQFLSCPNFSDFNGYAELSHHAWLKSFSKKAKYLFPWIGNKYIYYFIDDYSTPRVNTSMQRILNRIFFQRSSDFVCKIATEASTTFQNRDSSSKILQEGDDYQLVDLGEVAIQMGDSDREGFLDEIFKRRLRNDSRFVLKSNDLAYLLGKLAISKTEFARRLSDLMPKGKSEKSKATGRRGRAKAKTLYYGSNVFSLLWSGDTRTMIQLIQELLDEVLLTTEKKLVCPISREQQDKVFRDFGGRWLESQRRNEPSDRKNISRQLKVYKNKDENYNWVDNSYGGHLKAIVEAFKNSARHLLLYKPYIQKHKSGVRVVPRMAFRIEILDEFRINDLAKEIFKDLLRYGLFIRDYRGKSVRGAFVPRLYLRRMLLPYCTLALSKRDSVQINSDKFEKLLLYPDIFKEDFQKDIAAKKKQVKTDQNQIFLPGFEGDNDE